MRVLNTYTEVSPNGLFWVLLVVFVLLAVATYILKDDLTRFVSNRFDGFIYNHSEHVWKAIFGLVIVLALIFIPRNVESHIYAEATIIDEYPVGALYSKYEIKEKRGDLWVLELRDSYVESEEVAEE